jgi:hypothetical protein
MTEQFKPAYKASEARRACASNQDPSAVRNHTTELRWAKVPDTRWKELPGRHHNGRHGRTQTWRIRAVCSTSKATAVEPGYARRSVIANSRLVEHGRTSRTSKQRTNKVVVLSAFNGSLGIIGLN